MAAAKLPCECVLLLVGLAHTLSFTPQHTSPIRLSPKVRTCAHPRIISFKAAGENPAGANLASKENVARGDPATASGGNVFGSIWAFAKSPFGVVWLVTAVVGVIATLLRTAAWKVVYEQLGSLSAIVTIGGLIAGTLSIASSFVLFVACSFEEENRKSKPVLRFS